ncbi:MAG: hypothetical protein PHI97_24955 [Desulfobulbus sp.]|nr:hypothetical protein [Desulfobulbus sp.]
MAKPKSKTREEVCCDRFFEAYVSNEISYAYEKHANIDETQWYISGLWHLYYCPFCGTWIKGRGFGREKEVAVSEKTE